MLVQHFWILVLFLWSGCLGSEIASCRKTAVAIFLTQSSLKTILQRLIAEYQTIFIYSFSDYCARSATRYTRHALSGATIHEFHTIVKIAKTLNRYTLSQNSKLLLTLIIN